jgi:nitrite reductase/ring-hydroxylating ferredoxin subunit
MIVKRLLFLFLIYILFLLVLPGCKDQVRDEFPRSQFIGYFDLRDPRYSTQVFTARRDMDGHYVGISGIIVYNQDPNTAYAFDQMCPHEKKTSCSVSVAPDNSSIAECSCCGSQFLIASENGDVIEGPAARGLQTYRARVDGHLLVVRSY